MTNKIAFITGATSGVGRAVAIALTGKNIRLALVARNAVKGNLLRDEILRKKPSQSVTLFVGDLSVQRDIRQIANEFQKQFNRLDILINCAGVVLSKRVETSDGIETTFAVNYLSRFLLTNLLLNQLRNAAQGRVINVASLIPFFARVRFDDLQSQRGYNPVRAYLQSKVADVLFTYEMARQLKNTRVTVNAVHPGIVKTNLGVETSTGWLQAFVRLAMTFFTISPNKSAQRIVRLALAPELNQMTGRYFKAKSQPVKTPTYTYNRAVQQQLWQTSVALTGVDNKIH